MLWLVGIVETPDMMSARPLGLLGRFGKFVPEGSAPLARTVMNGPVSARMTPDNSHPPVTAVNALYGVASWSFPYGPRLVYLFGRGFPRRLVGGSESW